MGEKKGRQKFLTYRDAVFCGFLSLFPGTSAEALRYILKPETETRFKPANENFYSVVAIRSRMKKLHDEGCIETFRGWDRNNRYGASQYGNGLAQALLGETFAEYYKPLNGISISRIRHFSEVGNVAAQLISEEPFSIQNAVCENGVTLFELVPEQFIWERANAMKRAFSIEKQAGNTSAKSLEEFRRNVAKDMIGQLKGGHIFFSEAVMAYPELLAVVDKDTMLIPDLAVFLDEEEGRSLQDRDAKNVAIEVELSMKPNDRSAYLRRFQAWKKELDSRLVYGKLVYVCGSGAILRAVTEAATKAGLSSDVFKAIRLEDFEGKKNTVKPSRVGKDPKAKRTLGIPTIRVERD